jgi:hypothetical protein
MKQIVLIRLIDIEIIIKAPTKNIKAEICHPQAAI